MILKVYSIRDEKAETFGSPFYQATHGLAERSFRQVVSDEKTNVNKFPEDYDLWYLGEFDSKTGKFDALETPQHQLKAIQLVDKEKQGLSSVPPEGC